jgi:hypothetical protein
MRSIEAKVTEKNNDLVKFEDAHSKSQTATLGAFAKPL